jgi:hypothetical protein
MPDQSQFRCHYVFGITRKIVMNDSKRSVTLAVAEGI